jgi:hypothetical protein
MFSILGQGFLSAKLAKQRRKYCKNWENLGKNLQNQAKNRFLAGKKQKIQLFISQLFDSDFGLARPSNFKKRKIVSEYLLIL